MNQTAQSPKQLRSKEVSSLYTPITCYLMLLMPCKMLPQLHYPIFKVLHVKHSLHFRLLYIRLNLLPHQPSCSTHKQLPMQIIWKMTRGVTIPRKTGRIRSVINPQRLSSSRYILIPQGTSLKNNSFNISSRVELWIEIHELFQCRIDRDNLIIICSNNPAENPRKSPSQSSQSPISNTSSSRETIISLQ